MEDHQVARSFLDKPDVTSREHVTAGEGEVDGAAELRVLWLAYDEVSFYGLPALLDRLPVVRTYKVCWGADAFKQSVTEERYDVCVLPLSSHTDVLASLISRCGAQLVLTLSEAAESLLTRITRGKEPDAWLFEQGIRSAGLLDVFGQLMKNRALETAVNPELTVFGRSPKYWLSKVTERERSVLRLLCQGEGNQQIASALGISIHGVKRHISNLMLKSGCSNRTELALMAARLGFALPPEGQP